MKAGGKISNVAGVPKVDTVAQAQSEIDKLDRVIFGEERSLRQISGLSDTPAREIREQEQLLTKLYDKRDKLVDTYVKQFGKVRLSQP